MKRRIATSSKIAELKKRLRNSAELEYQTVLQRRHELFAQLHTKRKELQEAEERMAAGNVAFMSIAELQAWNGFIETCRSQLAQLEQEIREFDVVCEGKRAFLVERYVDEKKWVQYNEQLVKLYSKKIVHEEQNQLDEIAVQRSSRAIV
jgi:flagellar export protein FliJ